MHPDFTPDQFRVLLDWPVQWGDMDMFGHVNNTVYFRWFESSRVEYLNRVGLARLHGAGDHGPILAHVDCNFRRQLEFPDTVRIGSRVINIGRTSFKVEHALWSTAQNLALAANGTSTIVLFDYASQKPIRVPDDIRQLIEELEGKKFDVN
jgi:acyl-CoA thioester hydrolase